MQLLRTKVWAWPDIVLLKWCCLLVGAIVGAYCAQAVRQHAAGLALLALLLGIRPARAYWRGAEIT